MRDLSAYLNGCDAELRCREYHKTEDDSNTTQDFGKFWRKLSMITGLLLNEGILT